MVGTRSWVAPQPVLVSRRERARQQRLRRRKRYARVALVCAIMLLMLGPSLRAPGPLDSGAAPAPDSATPLGGPPDATVLAETFDNPLAGSGAALAEVVPPAGSLVPLGEVRIPKIDLAVPFFAGVHTEILQQGPGHWPGTPLPGTPGNAVLSGHRTTFTAPFNGLDLLGPGDEVVIGTGPQQTTFAVFETLIVPADEFVTVVLAQPAGPDDRVVTMFACHPKGSAAQRIVVRARAVGPVVG